MHTISTGSLPRLRATGSLLTGLLLTGLLLTGCQATDADQAPPTAPAEAEAKIAPPPRAAEPYSFVFLTDGPKHGELDEEEIARAAAGHRANIERLGSEGTLLLAGPFGEPKVDPSWRGIFVFDVPDLVQAEALTASDPAVEMGAFSMRSYPWRSTADLRHLRQLSQARKDNDEPFEGRAYVLGLGAPAADARRVLAGLVDQGLVPLQGTLGGDLDDHELFVLAVDTVEEAQTLLAGSEDGTPTWQLSAWYASALLTKLAP